MDSSAPAAVPWVVLVLALLALAGLAAVLLSRPQPPAARGPGPGSYTNLRAHETVLELGSRLLLEIKTNIHHDDGKQCQR
ncbi:hypothetical protein, partial [Geodermatophilus chilensis]|uniref:hypothetical protein n=1 Tax=Geodermatophilus chilensis TaxID=2035835 RepID=UPI001E465223